MVLLEGMKFTVEQNNTVYEFSVKKYDNWDSCYVTCPGVSYKWPVQRAIQHIENGNWKNFKLLDAHLWRQETSVKETKMTEFKVGDKAKVIKTGLWVNTGDLVEILRLDTDNTAFIKNSNGQKSWLFLYDLELVPENKKWEKFIAFDIKKVKRGDSIYYSNEEKSMEYFDYDENEKHVIVHAGKGTYFGLSLEEISGYLIKVEEEIPTTANGFVNLYYNKDRGTIVSSGGSIHPTRKAAEHFGKIGLDDKALVYIGTTNVKI